MMHPKNVNPQFAAWLVTTLILSSSCLAQDRGKMTLTDEELLGLCGQRDVPEAISWAVSSLERDRFDPNRIAGALLHESGAVVDGEFYGIPEPTEVELERLDREQVSFNFRVDKVYKGSAPDTVKVEAVSDMLIYPGRNTTRYAERMRIVEYQDAILRPISDQIRALQASFEEGEIAEESYLTQSMSLRKLADETAASQFKVTDHTVVKNWSLHEESTYYDHGEGIREDKFFLIQLDAGLNESATQVLDEVSTRIYSDERREDIIAALMSPQGIELPHPFRGYDPTDEQDCGALRELVGAPKPPPQPSEVARRLLDEFGLVALGEFIGIPDTVGEELHGHASDAVRMLSDELPLSFRIDTVFKGEPPEVLEVWLNSDMLEFPGSGVSRYVWRGQLWSDLESELSQLDEEWVWARGWRLPDDVESSVMSEREWQAWFDERFDSDRADEHYEQESAYFEAAGGQLELRREFTYFADTFYDRGGAISPYERYLLAINRGPDSFAPWRVSDTADGPIRIYWGDEAREIMKQLEVLVR